MDTSSIPTSPLKQRTNIANDGTIPTDSPTVHCTVNEFNPTDNEGLDNENKTTPNVEVLGDIVNVDAQKGTPKVEITTVRDESTIDTDNYLHSKKQTSEEPDNKDAHDEVDIQLIK